MMAKRKLLLTKKVEENGEEEEKMVTSATHSHSNCLSPEQSKGINSTGSQKGQRGKSITELVVGFSAF